MKEAGAFALAILVGVAWLGWSSLEYYSTTQNSDCGYTAFEACTHYARYEQKVIIWRGLAVLLAMILVLLIVRKR